MAMAIVLVAALIILFGFVAWVGPPYVPTLKQQIKSALDLLNLQPGQTIFELGSGDGRFARAAAKQGIRVVGYELNPMLVIYSKIVTWRYRDLVKIRWGNIWSKRWPEDADAIYAFLLDKFMPKLDKKITQTYPRKNIKLVSFAFEIPGKKPKKTKDGLFLYEYRQTTRS